MVSLDVKVEFPCGYKFQCKATGWLFSGEPINLPEVCPIHGKKCKRIKETKC